MKNLNKLFFFFLFTTLSVFAQSPEKISYQAVIRDANNMLLANQTVGMQISILQTTPTGTVVYTETHSVETNINGLVSLEIGAGSTSGTFSSIDWSAGPYFIKTETDLTGGSSYTITGTSQLMSVPFALYATTSGDGITTEQSDAIETNTAKTSMVLGTTAETALAGDTPTITKVQADAIDANTVKIGMPEGTEVGQINYWNGTSWQTINPGNDGAVLKMVSEMPAWVDDFTAPIITILNGTDTIEKGSPWTDAGAYADGGETVIVSGTVDTNNAGTYTIIYTATDTSGNIGTATRTVTVLESIAPVITSGTTGLNLVENSGAGQTVYTITANDAVGVTSYAIGGSDASLLSLAGNVVSLDANPDYETKSSYSFTVTASDAAGNTSDLTTVTFSITDVDDTAPVITSGTTGLNLVENSGAGQTVYTITANDAVGVVSFAIGGTDAPLLSVNTQTGIVTLPADPDYETKSSYSFTVTASDAAGNTSDLTTVTFSITDVDDTAPVITSGTTGVYLINNSGAGQTAYTIIADDNGGGTITSYAIGGTDAALLSVNSATGVVILNANPNYDTKSSYSFTVTASNATQTSSPLNVTFFINTNYAVGMEAQGGYIFYILEPNDPGYDPNIQHGLVCAVEFQSDGIRWDNGYNQYIGVNDTSIGSGLSNTDAIIAVQSIQAGASDFAARVARDYNGGGYNDWYLPSQRELLSLKYKIHYTPLYPFSDLVWTSSEYSDDRAWVIDFSKNYNGYIGDHFSKRGERYVIAVRSF